MSISILVIFQTKNVTIREHKIVVEEQGAIKPKPKRKCLTKVINKMARKS